MDCDHDPDDTGICRLCAARPCSQCAEIFDPVLDEWLCSRCVCPEHGEAAMQDLGAHGRGCGICAAREIEDMEDPS